MQHVLSKRQIPDQHRGPAKDQVAALLYRITDAVRATGLSRSKIYELIDDGHLRTCHFGRCVRITADSLHALIQRRADPLKEPPAPSETRQLLEDAFTRRTGAKSASK